jgi:hypothetical protein
MKKKTRVQAAKRRKPASANGKALVRPPVSVARRPAARGDAKAEIRRLKAQLVKA